MRIYLNVIMFDNGHMERRTWHVGDFTEAQLELREDFRKDFHYKDGKDGETSERRLDVWYTATLEDHEREGIALNRKPIY